MIEHVKSPNLPKNVLEVLLGEKYSKFFEKPLKDLGVSTLKVPDNPLIDKRLSGHADLSVFHFGQNKILLAPYLKGSALEKSLLERGFSVSFAAISQQEYYPFDAQLNVCAVGKNIILSPSVNHWEIVNYFANKDGYKVISSKQGYARCSTCVVDEGAIITADRGIAAASQKSGLKHLLIRPGHVALDGFSYGFIGGAAFKLSEHQLAFTGTLDKHPDKEAILAFLSSRKVEPVYITQNPVFDIGGILPVTEK